MRPPKVAPHPTYNVLTNTRDGRAGLPRRGARPTGQTLTGRGEPPLTKSRLHLLRGRNLAPTADFTSSSLHPAATDGRPASRGPGTQKAEFGSAAEAEAATAAEEGTSQQYARNLREQVRTLQAQVNMARGCPSSLKKGGAGTKAEALVETHRGDAAAHLQREAQQHNVDAAVAALQAELDAEREAHTQTRAALQALREQLSKARADAATAQEQRVAAQRQSDSRVSEVALLQREAAAAGERHGMLGDEVAYLKAELERCRTKEAELLRLARTGGALTAGQVAFHEAGATQDPSVHPDPAQGEAPLAPALGVDAQRLQQLTCSEAALRAELEEARGQLTKRDAMVQDLTHSLTQRQDEVQRLADEVRHEQQRFLMRAASNESDKVQLSDNERELGVLRAANAHLQDDVARLSTANEELFGRMRHLVEARQAADISVSNTLEGARQLQSDTRALHDALAAEQQRCSALRDEKVAVERQLQAMREQLQQATQKAEATAADVKKLDEQYQQRVLDIEESLKTMQSHQQQVRTAEDASIKSAESLLSTFKADTAAMRAVTHAAQVGSSTTTPLGAVTNPPVAQVDVPPPPAAGTPAAATPAASPMAATLPPPPPPAAPPSLPPVTAGPCACAGPATAGGATDVLTLARETMARERELRDTAAAAARSAGSALTHVPPAGLPLVT